MQQVMQCIFFRGMRSSLKRPPVSLLYSRKMVQQRKLYYKSYQSFCTEKDKEKDKPDDVKEETKETDERTSDKDILKSTIKEVFITIKDTAYEKAISAKVSISEGAKKFKKGANAEKDVTTAVSALNIVKHAWKKTFPSADEQAKERMEKVKERFAEQKKEEDRLKEYSEEDLAKLQSEIPEWKRTSIQQTSDGVVEKPGLRKQLSSKIANQVSKTEFAQRIKVSEEYKEYTSFKSEMTQFKEDVKEKVQNHPSNAIQGGIYVYKKVTTETPIAHAIKQMRMIDPEFDLFQLEMDAKVIFETIYCQYLRAEMTELEKVCGESTLGYFKVLLKKREAEKSEPKYKYLWQVEPAYFMKAAVPDMTKMPVFYFSIKAQEIYCYISKIDPNKIIDGDEERVMSMDFTFGLTPHLSPTLDEVGHSWELIEFTQSQCVKMLV